MKIAANATSYGIPIEVNVATHRARQTVDVHRPDGSSYATLVWRTEEPGRYFHPLIATLVSAGGRLLLAAAIHLAERIGSGHVMCDTDGLFIPATEAGGLMQCAGGRHNLEQRPAIKLLSWGQIDQQVVAPFARLNPYTDAIQGSILEIENENRDPDTGRRRQIECFAISAKRYCLFHREDGTPAIVGQNHKRKRSEHGLGHLLRPLPNDHDWKSEWWTHLLCLELGYPTTRPTWFNDLACGRLTVSTPHELRTWRAHNAGRAYPDQVRPQNFLMTAHPLRTHRGRGGVPECLVAPMADEPAQRHGAAWTDKTGEGNQYTVRTHHRGYAVVGAIPVQTYADYFAEYRGRPEHKALGPDRDRCHSWTTGALQPPVIEAASHFLRIGNESRPDREDTPDPAQSAATGIIYTDRSCPGCGAKLTDRQHVCSDRCRKRVSRRRR